MDVGVGYKVKGDVILGYRGVRREGRITGDFSRVHRTRHVGIRVTREMVSRERKGCDGNERRVMLTLPELNLD